MSANRTPSSIAREALRQLADRKLPPTPDNYRRVYDEIASPGVKQAPETAAAVVADLADELARLRDDAPADTAALRQATATGDWLQVKLALKRLCSAAPAPVAPTATWGPLIRELFERWEQRAPGLTQARKREALEHVLTAFASSPEGLYARLRALIRHWGDAATAPSTERQPLFDAAHDASAAATPGSVLNGTPAGTTPPGTVPAATMAVAVATPVATTAAALSPAASQIPAAQPAAETPSTASAWCGMLAQTLSVGIVAYLDHVPDLKQEGEAIARLLRETRGEDPVELESVGARLKAFWVQLELRGAELQEIQHGLLRVLHLLTENVAELVGDGSWMRGQLQAVAALAQGPIDAQTIAALEQGLREVTFQQGVLRPTIDQAKEAMKQMVSLFIDRMNELANETGDYHDRLARYAVEIERAEDLAQLSTLVVDVMQDTRGLQAELGRSRDELLEARRAIEEHQQRARRLEAELSALSDRLHEDFLTSTLNRRGLNRVFESEASRAERHDRPLSLSVLDVDNFKLLNDRLGHQAGDLALVHLARVMRHSIRPSDVIARFGGEEFVILLPETTLDDAVHVMVRVQRELTRRFFLHNHERVLITFSAGVAERLPHETQEEMIARADEALYRAKRAGKNRVAAASPARAEAGAAALLTAAIPAARAPTRNG